jgi:glycine/D-amino acid oxidase-like deaminating enzyme
MKVLVLGAGVVGVTTAHRLLKDGHEVTVIERNATAARDTVRCGRIAVFGASNARVRSWLDSEVPSGRPALPLYPLKSNIWISLTVGVSVVGALLVRRFWARSHRLINAA